MIRTLPAVRYRAPANIGVRQKEWSIIRVMLPTKPRGAGYTSASALLSLIAVPGGGINVAFTSVGDIDAWQWKRAGLRMEDASGKFALVMLRAKQVRVHHKRTKHEYVFRISDDRIEVAECLLHANHAAPVDPRDFREEAQAAAEWFVEKVPGFPLMSSTSSPGPVGWQRSLTSSVADGLRGPGHVANRAQLRVI